MPQQLNLRDLAGPARLVDRSFQFARHLRPLLLISVITAGAWIVWQGDAIWNRQLSALSPITAAEQALDVSLRNEMGAPDMRYIAALSAPDTEAALQAAEKLGAVLQTQVAAGKLAGFTSPAQFLPSQHAQAARRAALPDEASLRANLKQALRDLPLQPARLESFIADVQSTRSKAPLTRADMAGSSSALGVDSLLVQRAHDVLVLLPLRAPAGQELIDTTALDTAILQAGLTGVTVLDILEESTSLFSSYLNEAKMLVGGGMLVIFLLLLFALRSLPRALRATAPLACAVIGVTAGLLLCGITLTILHLIGLLLVVAIGRNYTLFFDAGSHTGTPAQQRQVQVSIVVANLTAVGSFGALALSQVPVLSYLGSTVGPGTFLALVSAAILASKAPADAHAD